MAAGDADDFDEHFDTLIRQAYQVAYRIVGNPGEAEDIAAEAMARALANWHRLRADRPPAAWVMRVTTNLSIDALRRRRFTSTAVVDAVAATVDADTAVVVRDLLRSLPRRQRDVLALRYLVDLSEVEIANVLGIAPGTVKRHASRGIARLRARLHSPEGGISLAW